MAKSPLVWSAIVLMLSLDLSGQTTPLDNAALAALTSHQYNLENAGRNLLIQEARDNDFFLLGELHGDNEIPALLRTLWPEMWKAGYRHIAAEISPWAAYQLEHVSPGNGPAVVGTWTRPEAIDVHALAGATADVLWGCDMEEIQVEFLIRELAEMNPDDHNLQQMVALTKDGYSRKMAPDLFDLAKGVRGTKDKIVNDISLRQSLLTTLEIEKDRFTPETKMTAQNERELLMKQQFLAHYNHGSTRGAPSKVLFRFGRNHLHRGYDARGISTLGNFMAEFAVAQGRQVFNVGAFGAGGKATLLGNTFDMDERKDELAFALLAEKAEYPATLYDLRPLRLLLHRIAPGKRSALETNLVYWSDSYDALIVYKTVTPLKP